MPLKYPKNQLVETASISPPLHVYSKLDEPSPYPPDPPVPETTNVVHYRPKPDRLQQIQEHIQVTKKDDYLLDEDWSEEIATIHGHKQHKST